MIEDLRFAWRQIRKAPGFAATAIVTLALGIGATTAIFSLLDQALLRSLPVRNPQQLVLLEATPYEVWNGDSDSNGGDPEAYFSYPMYKDLQDKNQVFDGLIAMFQTQAGVTWQKQSSLAATELVSGNYFDVLGVRPAVGRLLRQQDDQVRNGSPVAVLSFHYWKAHFAEDPHVVGQTLEINAQPFQILGVAAPGFASAIWGSPADLWVPMTMKPVITPEWDELDQHNGRWLNILGRLKPGETRAQAEAGMAPLWHALRQAELPFFKNNSSKFVTGFVTNSRLHVLDGSRGFSYSRNDMKAPLLVVMGLAGLVLLMAAVNVASLVLVRAAGRMREISMRYALGARRGRVTRNLFAEGLLLGVMGGAAGLLLAPVAMRLLVSQMITGQGEPPFSTQLDWRMLAFSFAVAVGVSLLFTLAPAVQMGRPDLVNTLKQGGGSVGGRLGFRRAIVGLQIGLSVLLLVCAGLFVRTLENLRSVHVGFATDHLITFGVDPRMAGYEATAVVPLNQRLVERLAALPGVESAGATSDPELSDNGSSGNISIEGYTPHDGEDMQTEKAMVTPAYFATLKVPMLAGRSFTSQDDLNSPKVVIVNEELADRFFGSPQKALGHMLAMGRGKVQYNLQIVGVVRNYLHRNVRGKLKMAMYGPVAQQTVIPELFYYVRTWSEPKAAMGMVRQAVAGVDSKLVLDHLTTMAGEIDENINTERMIAMLAVSFGVLAMLLAAVGLYGVLAYATAQRTREIGVRMALGSDRRGVVALVLRDVLKLAGISVVVTVPVALLATRLLKAQLFGVSNMDPVVFALVVVLMLFVAVVSAALPARRAARVEPMAALRNE
ncbi:MAG TPA: ABC transporter permease [Acidobacteriaceae bacterium]|nr:ABC transporter permease [Acidobacteriaceae bacterium]